MIYMTCIQYDTGRRGRRGAMLFERRNCFPAAVRCMIWMYGMPCQSAAGNLGSPHLDTSPALFDLITVAPRQPLRHQ